MAAGFIEKLGGIGAFIVDPQRDKFLTIEELRTKRSTNKLAGQRSLPMETIIPGETHRKAFDRLQTEEIQLLGFNLWKAPWRKLGMVEIADGVVLHLTFFELPQDVEIRLGSEVEEVDKPGWFSIEGAKNEPAASFRLRPGVCECACLYDRYREGPYLYRPGIIRFQDLRHKIWPQIFDLAEREGIRVEEALSRLDLPWLLESTYPPLAHQQAQPLFV